MKRFAWLVVPAAALALSGGFAVRASPRQGLATIGEFAFKVTSAMGQKPVNETAAVAALRTAGAKVGTNPKDILTAGLAADILRHLGVPVASLPNPGAAISLAKAEEIVRGVALTRSATFDSHHHHSGDCHVSPSTPGDCDDQGGDGQGGDNQGGQGGSGGQGGDGQGQDGQ